MLGHGGNEFVEHAALAEERMGAGFRGIGLEQPVHAETLAGGTEQGEQDDGKGIDEEQAVAASGFADAGDAKPHTEAQVFGIAKTWLDGPAFGVVVDEPGGRRPWVAGGQAPGFLHRLGMDTDDGPDLITLGCRDCGIAQFAGAASLADPFGDRPRLARGIGDVDVAAQSDDVAKAQFIEESEQLTVAEAAVGEDRDRNPRLAETCDSRTRQASS